MNKRVCVGVIFGEGSSLRLEGLFISRIKALINYNINISLRFLAIEEKYN